MNQIKVHWMTRARACCLVFLAVLAFTLPVRPAQSIAKPDVVAVITLRDTFQPVRARSFASQIEDANRSGAAAIVVNLATPGGMASSADIMVQAMRSSRIPVIVWLNLASSRVGGEGLRIVAQADASFMTKETYLSPLWAEVPRGSSPQQRAEGSQLLLKQLTDAATFHGRSTEAMRELAYGVHWFNPRDAMEAGLVDDTALSIEDLLRQVDNRTVLRGGKITTIHLPNPVQSRVTSFGDNFLLLSLMNPNLNVLLLTLGLLLIYLEINTPGIVIPGAAGLLLVLLSVFALSSLPVSWAGVLLCAVALLLLVLEARLHARGVLAIAGTLALVLGLAGLVRGPIPELQVAWATAIGAGLGFGGITAALMVLASEARRAKVKTGADAMLGWLAIAQTPLTPTGRILVRGELWNARLTSNDTSVAAGDRVKVLRADGLTLEVTAVPLTQSA